MSNNLILLFDAVGTVAFLLAAVLAARNYRYTKGVSRYWLAMTGTGLLGALSAACVLDESMGAVVFGPMHNYHLAYPALAVTMFTVGGICLLENRLTKVLTCQEETIVADIETTQRQLKRRVTPEPATA